MMGNTYKIASRGKGVLTIGTVDDAGWHPMHVIRNTLLYDLAGVITANLMNRPDGLDYHVNCMYLEFANSASAVSVPTPTRASATDYYDNLNVSDVVRDYLRVPVIAATGSISNDTNFSIANVGTYFAQTQGTTGVHGLTFAVGSNSRVYGGGLVVAREWGDPSKDIVVARTYFSSGSQVPKSASSQV